MTVIAIGSILWWKFATDQTELIATPTLKLNSKQPKIALSELTPTEQVAEVKQFLLLSSSKGRVDQIDSTGATKLIHAISNNCFECATLLLTAGADVNFAPASHMQPLLIAASAGEIKLVSLLLKHGANPNIKFNGENYSLLMDAAFEGNIEVATALLKHGALIDQQDRDGMSALHYASREGFVQMVELLLGHGADQNSLNQAGDSSWELAKRYQHQKIINLLE
jgi:uncharacterized protein